MGKVKKLAYVLSLCLKHLALELLLGKIPKSLGSWSYYILGKTLRVRKTAAQVTQSKKHQTRIIPESCKQT